MATATVSELKARVEALGYRLFVTNEGTQLVTDSNAEDTRVEVLFIHENDGDDDLAEWIADREKVSARVRQEANVSNDLRRAAEQVIELYRVEDWDALAGETDGGYKPLPDLEEALGALDRALNGGEYSDTPLDRARDDAQQTVYHVQGLVQAALKIAEDDVQAVQVLLAADEKLRALANDLDSVNWPKS